MSLFPPLLFSFFLDFIFHLGSPLFFLHNSVLRSRARFLLSLPPIVFPLFFIHFFSRSSARSFFYLRFFFLIFNSVSLRPCSSVAHRSFSPPLCSCSCLALRASFTPSRLSPTVYWCLDRTSYTRTRVPGTCVASPRRSSGFSVLVPPPPAFLWPFLVFLSRPLFLFLLPSSTAISFLLRFTPLSFPTNPRVRTYG